MRAVLFDLGNTLAEYFESADYPTLLPRCIEEAAALLDSRGQRLPPEDELRRRVAEENREEADHRVRPLEGRLLRIFRPAEAGPELVEALCRAFMKPIFDLGRIYDDSVTALKRLRARGLKLGVVSNAPWGCPAALCHEEAERLGLPDLVDAVVFCTDVGLRKPAAGIFEFILARLGVSAQEALFVGDHPLWDLEGPRELGMAAVLLDRTGSRNVEDEPVIRTLDDLELAL